MQGNTGLRYSKKTKQCIDHFNFIFILLTSFQSQMPDPKTYKQHFENKHPKADMPADLKDVVA